MQPSFKSQLPETARPNVMRMTFIAAFVLLFGALAHAAPDPVWQNLSSKRGELPVPPGGSTQQTGAVVADFDGDGDLE